MGEIAGIVFFFASFWGGFIFLKSLARSDKRSITQAIEFRREDFSVVDIELMNGRDIDWPEQVFHIGERFYLVTLANRKTGRVEESMARVSLAGNVSLHRTLTRKEIDKANPEED